ncbi:MAG TPA: S41 family peptidase [Nevskiaceae bacterium]|nr:S41 family peptidase [Nevskiaceae bacterium]
MPQQSSTEQHAKSLKQKAGNFIKPIGIGLGILLIFEFGVGIGNGTIGFQGTKSDQTGLPGKLNYSSVDQTYNAIRKNYDGKLTETQLLDGIKKGLAEATGDPYTEYFNTKDAKDFDSQLSGSFTGIGAELGKDANDNLIIVSPISGFPAAKAGLRPQDVIVSINNTSTSGMSINEAVSKIRGPKDTKVTLKIVRDKSQELSFAITRADIKVPSVKSEVLDGAIGYLAISQFGEDTTELTTKAAQDFKDKQVKGIVLDLRGDPGGLLNAAVDVSSLWLPQGKTVLQEKRGGEVVNTYTATGNNILQGIPTVVLIDEGSASASEIMAGALHDNKVAQLVGAKSYGKGSVQQILPLASSAEIKVTIARWYRPNGQNIDKKGITPDKAVKMTDDDYKNKRDPQKDAAIQMLQ